jgi:hypothetical protein
VRVPQTSWTTRSRRYILVVVAKAAVLGDKAPVRETRVSLAHRPRPGVARLVGSRRHKFTADVVQIVLVVCEPRVAVANVSRELEALDRVAEVEEDRAGVEVSALCVPGLRVGEQGHGVRAIGVVFDHVCKRVQAYRRCIPCRWIPLLDPPNRPAMAGICGGSHECSAIRY